MGTADETPGPTIQIKLDDDMIVDMWLTSARGALADPVDPDTLRRLLALSLDLIEALMGRIKELESDLFHAGPGTPTIVVPEPQEEQ